MHQGIPHSSELLKGTLQTIILKVLKDNEKMYGYEITQKVKALSEERIIITEGALYPALHKMEAEGMLITKTVKVDNRTRKYYSLTRKGNVEAGNRLKEFIDFILTMGQVLNIQWG
ncbi:MAG TPA: helix-turn-helix transcriptional regulator [Saprospiraceae bacterium]|nr:helix-turn-helix transcriptional regulator [Saprospiraceae bacterium]